MTEQDKKALGAINYLAKQLGVDLGYQRLSVAVSGENARAVMHDGSLEANVGIERGGEGFVAVESPNAPGIRINLVDHSKPSEAPVGAIYEIVAYRPIEGEPNEVLNGHVHSVYVGKDGIVLDGRSRYRVWESQEKAKKLEMTERKRNL